MPMRKPVSLYNESPTKEPEYLSKTQSLLEKSR